MTGHHGPFLVIPSRHGSVPNLTPDQARAILLPEERLLSVSVLDAQEFVQPCVASKMSLSHFCGLPDFRIFLPIRSSFQGMHASAPSSDKQISGDHERGRVSVTPSQWKMTVDALSPDFAVTMHESTPLSEPVNRRRRTAQSRSEAWLDQSMHGVPSDASSCPSPSILTPYSSSRCSQDVLIDVLPRNENLLEYADSLQCVADCRAEWSRAFCVATSLPAYLAAVSAGIDWIECSVPWDLAAAGIALNLALPAVDRELQSTHEATAAEPQLDLNDAAFALDIGPLAEHCSCFTCQRHCRAYVHHLLTVQEMNSEILLTIHNVTQLVVLSRLCRAGTSSGNKLLMKRIVDQL